MPVTIRSAGMPVAGARSTSRGRPSNGMTFVTARPGGRRTAPLLQLRRSSAFGDSSLVFRVLCLRRRQDARVFQVGEDLREQLALTLHLGNHEILDALTELHELRCSLVDGVAQPGHPLVYGRGVGAGFSTWGVSEQELHGRVWAQGMDRGETSQ